MWRRPVFVLHSCYKEFLYYFPEQGRCDGICRRTQVTPAVKETLGIEVKLYVDWIELARVGGSSGDLF